MEDAVAGRVGGVGIPVLDLALSIGGHRALDWSPKHTGWVFICDKPANPPFTFPGDPKKCKLKQ